MPIVYNAGYNIETVVNFLDEGKFWYFLALFKLTNVSKTESVLKLIQIPQ